MQGRKRREGAGGKEGGDGKGAEEGGGGKGKWGEHLATQLLYDGLADAARCTSDECPLGAILFLGRSEESEAVDRGNTSSCAMHAYDRPS